jgi:hypothetical protein
VAHCGTEKSAEYLLKNFCRIPIFNLVKARRMRWCFVGELTTTSATYIFHFPFMDGSNAIGQLGAHAAPALTALAAVTLAVFGVSRWRHSLRVKAEYAAALALTRAPYTLREALSDCRSHIIASGETPPGWRGPMDTLIAADAAVREVLPAIVRRYRSAGVLTWALLHEIEADVLAHLASTGQHRKRPVPAPQLVPANVTKMLQNGHTLCGRRLWK